DVVQTGVLVSTCQPYIRGRATKQANATAQLGRTLTIEGVVETNARLHQLVVNQMSVVVAEQLLNARVVQALVAEAGQVNAHTEHQIQVVIDRPCVLHEQARVLQIEGRR